MENKRDITPITISYNAVIKRIDRHTGEVLDVEKIHNLVVTAGKERIRDYIAGLSTVDFSNIAIGQPQKEYFDSLIEIFVTAEKIKK